MFSFFLGPPAEKFLKKCETDVRERIIKRIRLLAQDPFPSDSKRILGRNEKMFRIRVGDYRIIYLVYYEKNEILIADIDKRSKIYL